MKHSFRRVIPLIGVGLLLTAALAVALSTRPASLETLAGSDYPAGGKFSFADAVQAAGYLPGRVEAFFNKNFTGRDWLVHLNYAVRLKLLGERDFHDVVVGRDGWLFYSGERNLDYYQNAGLMTPMQVRMLAGQLEQTRAELEEQGIAFYLVVAPNKESIYPEYLPDGIRRGVGQPLLDRLENEVRGLPLNLIDLRPALTHAKAKEQVYYRTDTHWNPVGAQVAYGAITSQLRTKFPAIPLHTSGEFEPQPETISGDLSVMLTMQDELSEESVELKPKFERCALTEPTSDPVVLVSTCADDSLPRAMVFHDSFYNGLQPFLNENFRQVIQVHSFTVDMEWVAKEKPDVVILEVAERYLPELLRAEEE